jgi:P4 family phage/plasmid primase-like protien
MSFVISPENYNTNFFKFLKSHSVSKGNESTHSSMGEPFGSFFISTEEYEEFYNLYNMAINDDIVLHIIEKHTELSPLLVDLDFKFALNEVSNRLIDGNHIKNILRLYVDEIKKHFIVTDEQLVSCVFMRSSPYIKGNDLKDGIHIIFPYIVSAPDIQYYIRNEVLKNIPQVLDNLPNKNLYSDIVDEKVISSTGWLMYGSCKPDLEPYRLATSFDSNLDILSDDIFEDVDYTRLFSIRNKTEPTLIQELTRELLDGVNEQNLIIRKKSKIVKRTQVSESELIDIENLIGLLDPQRSDDEDQWIKLGWCLHNTDETNEKLLNAWIKFSKKSTKFISGECERRWNAMSNREDGITIGTLHYWAQHDDISEYSKIRRRSLEYYVNRSMSGSHFDIASVLFVMFKNLYVCASYKNKIWYKFDNHRWRETDSGVSLRSKITNDLYMEYTILMGEYNKKCTLSNSSVSDEEREEYKKKSKTISKITMELRNTNFKTNIMNECRELFHDPLFLEKIDTRRYLLCFENGVYDLKTDTFRDGRPDDNLSISCGIDYIPYDIHSNKVFQINEFMSQVFVNYDIREYVWKLMASYMQGHNADELFHLWIGTGSNSKSKLIELFESAFGDYCIKFPITLLTQKRASSNAATPEIAQSKGKRFGSFQEPGMHEKLNIGLMKELTGGDKIKARALYTNPIEFKPQFKLLLVCNHFPDVPGDDDATWRRIRVVEFKSKFVNDPDPENPLEFQRDSYLSDKMQNWPETFMSMLLEYYKSYKATGLSEPAEIMKYTNEYQQKCDTVSEFFNIYTLKTGIITDIISLSNIFDDYREWFIDMYSNLKQPSKNDFITYMKKKYQKDIKKGQKKNEFYISGYIKTDNQINNHTNDDDE